MRGLKQVVCCLAAIFVVLSGVIAHADVFDMPPKQKSLEMVTVGNADNAPDSPYYGHSWGAVADPYRIGKYEVTAGQYTQFLNAVAKTDTYGLYNSSMWSGSYGCKIKQESDEDGYTYSVASDWADRPVNYVGWGDAARFCNWLTNAQPTGNQNLSTTEDGSYYLNGANTNEALRAVTREADAKWWIPNENEWYKAAYHKNDGVTGNYWNYQTQSDVAPVAEGPPGRAEPPGSANYDWAVGGTTEVGAYSLSPSPYGTFDQGGNLREWLEDGDPENPPPYRLIRGGSFDLGEFHLWDRAAWFPANDHYEIGFRVASIPEPGSIAMCLAGTMCLLAHAWRWRRQTA
jgi:formylglycine-generating enzyme